MAQIWFRQLGALCGADLVPSIVDVACVDIVVVFVVRVHDDIMWVLPLVFLNNGLK